MKSYLVIPVHSFVDLITNSSSEVYVMASKGTIQSIKDIVNHLLAAGHSTLNADDLFEFDLCTRVSTFDSTPPKGYEGYSKEITEKEFAALKAQGEFADDAAFEKEYDGDSYQEMSVRVTAKDPSNEKIAALLSNLEGLFQLEASYNG
jgi:hypothetical protein